MMCFLVFCDVEEFVCEGEYRDRGQDFFCYFVDRLMISSGPLRRFSFFRCDDESESG